MAGSIWTVRPLDKPVELDYNGIKFTIRLKKQLSAGERRQLQTAGWKGIGAPRTPQLPGAAATDPEIKVDWKEMSFARASLYLTDWSLKDDDERKLPITQETIEALQPDVFDLIEGAITAHVEEMEAEKKAATGK